MPLEDLDLEFEDEEESKRKKSDAVNVDVDLEFQSPEVAKPRPMPKGSRPGGTAVTAVPQSIRPAPAPAERTSPGRPAEVRNIEEARPNQTQQIKRPMGVTGVGGPGTQSRIVGTAALKEEQHPQGSSNQDPDLLEQMRKVELDAKVRVAVLEFKTDYLVEMLSDMKLMDHQIGQLLSRINAKHPDLKNEVLMIKKILADFVAKKRK